ncbi:hypothetical protein [Kitasatospora sp. KL5]
MDIAALVTWLVTALAGFYTPGVRIRRGGVLALPTALGVGGG